MKLPNQAKPVNRQAAPEHRRAAPGAVNPSDWLDDLGRGLQLGTGLATQLAPLAAMFL